MKRDVWLFLLALALIIGSSSCKDNDIDTGTDDENPFVATTYISLDLKPTTGSPLRASEDGVNNYLGTYEGWDLYEHIDIYITTPDGSTLLMNQRYMPANLTTDPATNNASITVPFKAAPGQVNVIVVVNGRNPIMPAVPPANYLYTNLYSDSRLVPSVVYGGATTPGTAWARTENMATTWGLSQTTPLYMQPSLAGSPSYIRKYRDHISMIGTLNNFTIVANVSQAQAAAGQNLATVPVTKTAARAYLTLDNSIVTNTDGSINVVNPTTSALLGTISNLSFSLAQTANQAYLYLQTVGSIYPGGYGTASPNTTYSWGFEFVPGLNGNNYNTQARTYYDYNDLVGDVRPIPVKPIAPENGNVDFGIELGIPFL